MPRPRVTPTCPKCRGPTHVLSWQARVDGAPTREDSLLAFCRTCRIGVDSEGRELAPVAYARSLPAPAREPASSLQEEGAYATKRPRAYATGSSLPSKPVGRANAGRRTLKEGVTTRSLRASTPHKGQKLDATKARRILKLRDEHPDWSGYQIAVEVGESKSSVYRVLREPDKWLAA